jgi:hypothetical protein
LEHKVQADAPELALNVPLEQEMQVEAPLNEYEPAEQYKQSLDSETPEVAEDDPEAQSTHEVADWALWYLPYGQALHSVEPVVEA